MEPFCPSDPFLRTVKISAQWSRVDTNYFTHNWETRGGRERLIPSCTGLKDLPAAWSHAEDHTEQTEAASGDHCRRKGRFQSRKEHHRADFQPKNPVWEIPPASAKPLPCLHRLQKAFDRVWHATLWAIMKKDNISANLILVIKYTYDKATSAALFNGNIGDWFWTTVAVW